MRIGIDCRMYSSAFTGIGRYTFELVKRLKKIDKENDYFLFFNEPQFSEVDFLELESDSSEKAGITKQGSVNDDGTNADGESRFYKVLADAKHYSFKEQTVFLKKIRDAKLDLMHFTHFNAPILYKGKSIVTIHDLTLSFYPGKKMTSAAHRAAYHLVINSITKRSKKIIAVSQNTKNDLIKLLKIPNEKIEVIYEGVGEEFTEITDEKILSSVREKYKTDSNFLLYTGVWRSHKNLVGLIEAFKILKNKYSYKGKLVITGKKDPAYPEVIETIEKLGLSSDVVLTGLVSEDDLIALLSAAEVFVFPSFYEGFGLPPLEAFACATPVAASNSSCVPEICGKGNAKFFDPHNVNDMAEKIFEVASSSSLKKQLIDNGKKRLQDFDWDKMVIETLKIYKNV